MWQKSAVQIGRPVNRLLCQNVTCISTSLSKHHLASQDPITTSTKITFPKQHEWNRAVAVAERLVGFPTSVLQVHSVMTDEVSSMVTHMRKLMGSDHPVLRTLKRLIFQEGKNNLQIRGLIMLLLSRATNQDEIGLVDLDTSTGVTAKQRKLAELVEMILAAQAIHKSVLNLPHDIQNEKDEILRDDLLQLEYGNKIAILGGDYLLANACTGLADLRNTYIVEMISVAIAEFTQAEFLGRRDVQGRLIPSPESISIQSWQERNSLAYGTLLASGCKSCMLLSDQPETVQGSASRLGKNIALALQAYTELQPFSQDSGVGFTFQDPLDLSAAPVLFHLQNDRPLLDYVMSCNGDIKNLDSKQIYEAVSKGLGLNIAQDLCRLHANEALNEIKELKDGDAKSTLLKLVQFLAN